MGVLFKFLFYLSCSFFNINVYFFFLFLDTAGNEYDLSDLSRDNEPWIAIDTSDSAKNRTFYLNVCKPLPYIRGCPGKVLGQHRLFFSVVKLGTYLCAAHL